MSSSFFLSSWLCGNACQSFDYYGFTIISALVSWFLWIWNAFYYLLSVLTSYCKMWRLDSELRVWVVVWLCGVCLHDGENHEQTRSTWFWLLSLKRWNLKPGGCTFSLQWDSALEFIGSPLGAFKAKNW